MKSLLLIYNICGASPLATILWVCYSYEKEKVCAAGKYRQGFQAGCFVCISVQQNSKNIATNLQFFVDTQTELLYFIFLRRKRLTVYSVDA